MQARPALTRKIATDAELPTTSAMAEYESELTRFIRELKSKQPDLERKQREGRAIWWDKELDPEQLKRWQESRVPQQPYVYQTERGKD
jgi:hypothetical protein